jgi:hypothetical protein
MTRTATWRWTGAAVLVLVAGVAALPPPAADSGPVSPQRSRHTIAGAYHVHTSRSDGTGSVEDVAAAAARAGLDFLVLTDHGDGRRAPEGPVYRSGVLVIDGVEISTTGGHYAVVGMAPAPYPLAGEARDVVEDVARLGGFGVASHGDSPDPELRWSDWQQEIDALEWLNLGTAWRQATAVQIARASISYWFRPPETLALAMARPVATLERLDRLARGRRVIALAATDAHGPLPRSYEACFRTITTRLQLDVPLDGHASDDARKVMTALRAGRHYSVVDALGTPTAFEFSGRRDGAVVRPGDVVTDGSPIVLEAHVDGPRGTMLTLLRDGTAVHETVESRMTYQADGRPAGYRVEARMSNAPGEPPVPWILSNPIFVGIPARVVPTASPPAATRVELTDSAAGPFVWHTETDKGSVATLTPAAWDERPALALHFTLGGGVPRNQFVALVLPAPPDVATYDRMTFRAFGTGPMRLSVQLRQTGHDNPARWRRSVYLDQTPRTVTIVFDDMTPVPPNTLSVAPRTSIGGVLLVLDTTNTVPGATGEIVFTELALERTAKQD